MSITPPLLTPSSGKSVYFDAPQAHYSTSVRGKTEPLWRMADFKAQNDDDDMLSTNNTPLTAMLAEQKAREPAADVKATEPLGQSETGASPQYQANGAAPVSDKKEPIPATENAPATAPATTSEPTKALNDTKTSAFHESVPADQTSEKAVETTPSSPKTGSVTTPTHGAAAGSGFGNGAVTSGPNATPEINDSVHVRARSAETAMTEKSAKKITKTEREYSHYKIN